MLAREFGVASVSNTKFGEQHKHTHTYTWSERVIQRASAQRGGARAGKGCTYAQGVRGVPEDLWEVLVCRGGV